MRHKKPQGADLRNGRADAIEPRGAADTAQATTAPSPLMVVLWLPPEPIIEDDKDKESGTRGHGERTWGTAWEGATAPRETADTAQAATAPGPLIVAMCSSL